MCALRVFKAKRDFRPFLIFSIYMFVHFEVAREGNSQHNHRVHSSDRRSVSESEEEEEVCFFPRVGDYHFK